MGRKLGFLNRIDKVHCHGTIDTSLWSKSILRSWSMVSPWLVSLFSLVMAAVVVASASPPSADKEMVEGSTKTTGKRLKAEHGVVCRTSGEQFGYFGWPTVARMDDGTLVVASSGLRQQHICPFGKTVLNVSRDNGHTWSPPQIIQDSLIDDRDAGIINLGDRKLLVSWFRSDTRKYANGGEWSEVFTTWTDKCVNSLVGSWAMSSGDGGATWGKPIRAPVFAPHGPLRLRNGELLYLGKPYKSQNDIANRMITAAKSRDGGSTWGMLGTVPTYPKTDPANYHEPHVIELPTGHLIGMIRIQNYIDKSLTESGVLSFSLMQTESDDGGHTWTVPRPLNFHGSPPHLLRHSTGVLILTYGFRQRPFGQHVAFSNDDGSTWDHDWIIRDDGPDGDLGYPTTVELADGSCFTVYYQKAAVGEKCSLLWSRWRLPKN